MQLIKDVAKQYAERVCSGQFPIEYTREQVVKHTAADYFAGIEYFRDEAIKVLNENLASTKSGLTDEDKVRSAEDILIETYEDLIMIFSTDKVYDKPPASQPPPLTQGRMYVCPKCNGQGRVVFPPHLPFGVDQWAGTETDYVCDICQGAKVLYEVPVGDASYDWDKLLEWVMDENRKKAITHFTSSPARDVATIVEALIHLNKDTIRTNLIECLSWYNGFSQRKDLTEKSVDDWIGSIFYKEVNSKLV